MYARIAQLTAKSGQVSNLDQAVRDRLLPMLKQQPGFIDALGLHSDTESNQFVGITIWKSKEDAEKSLASQPGQQFRESIRPLLESDPVFRTFDLEISTVHNVGISRAASSS